MKKLILFFTLLLSTNAWAIVPSATPLYSQYSCNSSTTQWPYTFQISATSDIQVYVNDNAGTITTIPTSSYTVDTSNVWVTYPLVGSACPTGSTITLVPATPQTQLLSLTNRSPFVGSAIGSALDKVTLITQQLQGQLNRAVLAPAGTTAFTFPSAVPNNILGWDPSGSGNIVNFVPNTGAYLSKASTNDAQLGTDNNNFMTAALVATEVNYASSSVISIPANNLAGSIPDTKLSTISTAGKVSGASFTSLSSIPIGAGTIPANNLPTSITSYVIPSGGIIMWSGTIATIPSGWFLCDGNNSTPDLRNRFIVAADADSGGVAKSTITGSAAQSGGSTTIDITQIPAHTHSVTILTGGSGLGNGGNSNTSTGATGSAGGGLPYTQPFYALAYIMKS